MGDWFVLRVKPRHEKHVATAIGHNDCEHLLPQYRSRRHWKQRSVDLDLPLFPGYVFCKFGRSSWSPIMSLPGVIDVVRSGRKPVAVCDDEIRSLTILQRNIIALEPWPYVRVGEKVQIIYGPLSGVVGSFIEARGKRNLVLSVDLVGRSVLVHLDVDSADPTIAWAAYTSSVREYGSGSFDVTDGR